ncbi:energy transducer TonB [Sphingomonas sp. Leaf17]|uniref:energy transducer TonB n=1 Tax=Sphingomonas sp. Leaf17 TaxID=1735683 RepID=UPI00138F0447|nr:energy transducer TonB [Sphingomonas sp. Leaf17]
MGKWALDYGASRCVLSHAYAGGGKTLSMGLQPSLMNGYGVVILLLPQGMAIKMPFGTAAITLPSGERFEGAYASKTLADEQGRAVRIDVEDKAFVGMLMATNISISLEDAVLPPLALNATPKTVKALKSCREAQMTKWGVDLATVAKTATPAEAIAPASWISTDDYPTDAVRAGKEGTTAMLLTIGVTGAITDCRVIQTSGSESLDSATCRAFLRRARYTPAKDKDGAPVIAWDEKKVNWTLPQ